jgi:multicomponent Na+:H+ antiporter subunit F
MTAALVLILLFGALIAIALAVVRLLKGPSQADRIVALDVVFSANIVLTAVAALATDRVAFLDIGIGLSIVGFVATIVWARLIDKSPRGTA